MDDNYWVEETSLVSPSACKVRKRRTVKRKFEFIGWGSRPLIEFLEAIGKDTNGKPTQREVAAFITKYVNEKGLVSAEKKKKVLCDDRLHALFGKKSVSRLKVYDMLEEHFAENHDDSDDEFNSSDEEGCDKRASLLVKRNPSGQIKKLQKTPKSCFAAVNSENMKRVYLKRSLIQDLLKVNESFEFKVVGSFVRIKSDPNDIFQKNRFQLQQVTGVEKVPGAEDAGIEILLRVSNFFKEVPISMLSDDNFSEEEVEDVRDRIKGGLLTRLSVKAVEEKAQILHADITNHWIAREIMSLQHKIDHANEKGWRREYTMFDYLDRRKMLQTSSEQEKLLLNIPDVIAEEIEPEVTAATATSEKEEGSGGSPKSILRATSDVSSKEVLGCGGIVAPSEVILSESHAQGPPSESIDATLTLYGDKPGNNQQFPLIAEEGIEEMEVVMVSKGKDEPLEKPGQQQASKTIVIDLCDYESEDEAPTVNDQSSCGESPNDAIWHYMDPQGQTRGPFPLYLLKRWSDASYFHSGFRVWKSSQTSCEGVLLIDLLSRSFPN